MTFEIVFALVVMSTPVVAVGVFKLFECEATMTNFAKSWVFACLVVACLAPVLAFFATC